MEALPLLLLALLLLLLLLSYYCSGPLLPTLTYMNLKVRNRNGTANRNRFLRNRLNRNAGFRNREPANQTAGSVPDHS